MAEEKLKDDKDPKRDYAWARKKDKVCFQNSAIFRTFVFNEAGR